MRGLFRVLGRVAGFLLRFRALRPLIGLAALLWAFDALIRLLTDAAWFSSVGFGALWRTQLAWKAEIGGVFILVCLGASVAVMRAVAKPVSAHEDDEPPLPRAMQRWQPLRSRVLRLGWFVLLLSALLLGRGVASHWSEFALWSGRGKTAEAEFWMLKAPAIATVLAALWKFSLILGVVGLVVGALRALPFLAARPSVRPVRWLRTLSLLAAGIAVLRALGFVYEAAWHAQVANENELARTLFIFVGAIGVLGCLVLGILAQRPRLPLLFGVVGVLVLPALTGDFVSLFAGRGTNTPLEASPIALEDQAPTTIPLGDEATLLRLARSHLARDGEHVVVWQSAGLSTTRSGQSVRADLVGTRLITDDWLRHGITDNKGDLTWKSLDLPAFTPSKQGQPLGPLFYGVNERVLVNDGDGGADVGVPITSWVQKLAWAWRLRDPFLPFDAARAKRLIIKRGAVEIGRTLAPFWVWDEAVPRRDPKTGAGFFECVAYSTSANFPRRAPFEQGVFAGQNAVYPVAVLRLDARSGTVQIASFASNDAVTRRWLTSVPSLFASLPPHHAPTPALEVALANGGPLAWTRENSGQKWERRAIPAGIRAQVRDKLAEFAGDSRTRSFDGATPVLWKQNKTLWMAQAFFARSDAKNPTSPLANADVPLKMAEIAFGPLTQQGLGWGGTLADAQAALQAQSSPSVPRLPVAGDQNPTRSLAQSALVAQRAAAQALKAGRYVEAARQNERLHSLLEELAKSTK